MNKVLSRKRRQNIQLQSWLQFCWFDLIWSRSTHDHEDIHEEVDHVEVDVEGGEDVLLGVEGVLVVASHHQLSVVDQIEREDESSSRPVANHVSPAKIFVVSSKLFVVSPKIFFFQKYLLLVKYFVYFLLMSPPQATTIPTMNPATKRMMRRAKRTPPQTVKSILVWKAKRVRPRVTAAVIPTAMRTASTS